MPPNGRLTLGIGAECKALKKHLHPQQLIDRQYPNFDDQEELDKLLVIAEDRRIVNRNHVPVVVFRHDDFPNKELYCARHFAKVVTECPPCDVFGAADDYLAAASPGDGREIPREVFHNNDIDIARACGFDVDDDNAPIPENIPSPGDDILAHGQQWVSQVSCPRRNNGFTNPNAKLNGCDGIALESSTYLSMFLFFLPKKYIETVLIPQTNRRLQGQPLTLGEFLRFIGLWLVMATFTGYDPNDFWSSKPIRPFEGVSVRLNKWMSKNRFDSIVSALCYTNAPPPRYKDKFHNVRQIIQAWNDHMSLIFNPSWISCLDKSMSIWLNNIACPGWIVRPIGLWRFGNEYHTICCGECGVMYRMEMVEGRDAPPERSNLHPEDAMGKTVGLLIRLCQPLVGTGKVVILNSDYCVLKAIVELKKKSVFASAWINKRKSWPKYVPGDAMDERMATANDGDSAALQAVMEGISYTLFVLKGVGYNMKIMATYSSLIIPRDAGIKYQLPGADPIVVKYPEPFHNHVKYRGVVNDHNQLRMTNIALEETWVAHQWQNRVFAFIIAVVEVNAYKAFRHFVGFKEPVTILQWRRKLAQALIHNDLDCNIGSPTLSPKRKTSTSTAHTFETAPPHARRFEHNQWQCDAKAAYQQYVCRGSGCKKTIRTYCSCNPGHWLCATCFGKHVEEEVITE